MTILSQLERPDELKVFVNEVGEHFSAPDRPKPFAENSGIKLTTEALDAWVRNAKVLSDEDRAERMGRLRSR
jgi:hypothetical protein